MTAVDKCFSMYEQAFLAKRVSQPESKEQAHVTCIYYHLLHTSLCMYHQNMHLKVSPVREKFSFNLTLILWLALFFHLTVSRRKEEMQTGGRSSLCNACTEFFKLKWISLEEVK